MFTGFDHIQPMLHALINNTVNQSEISPAYKKITEQYPDPHLRRLAGVTFGESGKYDPKNEEGLKDEMRTIINTINNRSKELGAANLTQVLTQKQANGRYSYHSMLGKQFKKFMEDKGEIFDKEKRKLLDEVMHEFVSGKLKDNTNGANSFKHDDNKKLIAYKQKLTKLKK